MNRIKKIIFVIVGRLLAVPIVVSRISSKLTTEISPEEFICFKQLPFPSPIFTLNEVSLSVIVTPSYSLEKEFAVIRGTVFLIHWLYM